MIYLMLLLWAGLHGFNFSISLLNMCLEIGILLQMAYLIAWKLKKRMRIRKISMTLLTFSWIASEFQFQNWRNKKTGFLNQDILLNINKLHIIFWYCKSQLIYHNQTSKIFTKRHCNIWYKMIIYFANRVKMFCFIEL